MGFWIAVLLTWIGAWEPKAQAVSLEVDSIGGGRVRLIWPAGEGVYLLESSGTLAAPWVAVDAVPQDSGGKKQVELLAAGSATFFRLRRTEGTPLTIAETSPAAGERGVAVTRETIFRLSGSLAGDTTLGTNQVYAVASGRRLLSRVALSQDRRTVTLFYMEPMPSDARVEVVFDGTGVFDAANLPVDVDGDGIIGGIALLEFETLSTVALSTTAVEGRVFASEKNADGTSRPLANVTISVDGREEALRTTTDAAGYFRLSPSPAGRFFVSVDGRTAEGSEWPTGGYYPFVGKAWEASPGLTNNLAGGTGEIFLPWIPGDALRSVSATDSTTVTFSASVLADRPDLAGVEIQVPPNALYSDSGARGGRVGIAPVPPDRLPEPLPMGLNLPLVITIQTDGSSNFDGPVPVRFPNLPDPLTGVKLGPGEKTVLWSFNHDTGQWEPQGTMTISADGQFAVSDPGVGVLQPGWHGAAPGSQGGGPPGPRGQKCEDLNGNGVCDADDEKRCEVDLLKTKFAAVDAFIGLVPSPDMGPLGTCLNGGVQSGFQAVRDCGIDPKGCRETVALKVLDFSIDCGLSFVPASAEFREAVTWTKRVKGLFDAGLAYANYDLCKKTAAAPQGVRRPAAVVAGFATANNPFLQQYEIEIRLHRFIELMYGDAIWAEIDPTEWGLTKVIMASVRGATLAASENGKRISAAERTAILGLRRPRIIGAAEVEALITRFDALINQEAPAGGDLTVAEVEETALKLGAILQEVSTEGWRYVYDGYLRGIEIQASLENTAAAASVRPSNLELSATLGPQTTMPIKPLHYRLVDRQTGIQQVGRLNSAGALARIILRPNAPYLVGYFDEDSGRAGFAYFTSGGVSNFTRIPGAVMVLPPAVPDTDGDGLSDVAEAILGTDSSTIDTDGDGVSDGAEIANGTVPTDGQAVAMGTVATRDTEGRAVDIDTANDFAVVADSQSGLAVFNVANPLAPVLVDRWSQTSRRFESVAMAGMRVVAVPGQTTATGARVYVFDMESDGKLSPPRTVDIGGVPSVVAALGRYGYAPAGTRQAPTLAVVDLDAGMVLRQVPLATGAAASNLAIDGDILWAITDRQLISYRISGDQLLPLGTLAVTNLDSAPLESGPELAVGQGRLYLGDFNGFRIVEVTDPASPRMVREPVFQQAAVHDLALTGTGYLLPVTSFGGTTSLAASVYDIRGDVVTNVLATYETPGATRAVVLHRGYALAADDGAGLAVVHFLPPDRGTLAPTIGVRAWVSRPPEAEESGNLFAVSTVTTDDVLIRDVEFHLDGSLVARSGKFPFSATLRAPVRDHLKTNFVLRAKATDTGGNSAWSDEVRLSLLPDITAPKVVSVQPTNGSTLARGSVLALTARFDSLMDAASLNSGWTLTDFGPDGVSGTADDAVVTGGLVSLDVEGRVATLPISPPLKSGKYLARLATTVSDRAGNGLASPTTWTFSIPAARLAGAIPPDQSVLLAGKPSRLELRFDERLTASTVTPTSVWLAATNGVAPALVAGGKVAISSDGRGAVLTFSEAIPNGNYRLFWTKELRDVYGASVDTNGPVRLAVKGPVFWTNRLAGAWSGRTNWVGGIAPGLNDHVVIEVPDAEPKVTISTAPIVTTLRSTEDIVLTGVNSGLTVVEDGFMSGSLTVTAVGFQGLQAQRLRVTGPAVLTGSIAIGDEVRFEGPVVSREGDWSLRGGRSRFFNRVESSRTIQLGGHEMVLDVGGEAVFGDIQIQFGGRGSQLTIAPGGRLESNPANTTQIRNSFISSQGASEARVVNAGEWRKTGPGATLVNLPLSNSGHLSVEQGRFIVGSDSQNVGTIEVGALGRLELGNRFRHAGGRLLGEGAVLIPNTAVLDAPYEVSGLTEVIGSSSSGATFNGAVQSGGQWMITARTIFNGPSTALHGPVVVRSGGIELNSPGESLIPNLTLESGSRLAGNGLLVFREERLQTNAILIQGGLTVRFDAPVTFTTNLSITDTARVDLAAGARWLGGSVSGDLRSRAGTVLEFAPPTAGQLRVEIPMPQVGTLRKTGDGLVTLLNRNGTIVTNRSRIEVLSGSLTAGAFSQGIYTQPEGLLYIEKGAGFFAQAVHLEGGELEGAGRIHVFSDAINRGCHLGVVLSPGPRYGVFSFTGEGGPNVLSGARLIMDVGGITPGVDLDQVTVERRLQISGGTLEIRTAPEFAPTLGQEITLFTANAVAGRFTEATGLDLPNNRRYRVVYDDKTIRLRVESR
ncbi:MAG: Ig-like domain-containing protein [Verrucomicrobiales bacterium]|nr:Ig-like domain-containing protein [Verrucomicrobiales bacterium]